MGKRVIGLLGSPLSEGNTARLLEKALQGARDAGCETEVITVSTLCFESCMEMMFCKEHDTCIMDDDMQAMYGKIRELDGLILATPVMTMGVPGKLKSFFDRCQIFFMAKYVRRDPLIKRDHGKRRRSLFICISGMNVPGLFDGIKRTVHAFLDIIDCPLLDELLVPGMDALQNVSKDEKLLDAAYWKGHELGRVLNTL